MHQAVAVRHWSQKRASNEQVNQVRVFALMAHKRDVPIVDAVFAWQKDPRRLTMPPAAAIIRTNTAKVRNVVERKAVYLFPFFAVD